jgi:hypothetical protein
MFNKKLVLKNKNNIEENNLSEIEIEYSKDDSIEDSDYSCKEVPIVPIDPGLSG